MQTLLDLPGADVEREEGVQAAALQNDMEASAWSKFLVFL